LIFNFSVIYTSHHCEGIVK